MADAERLAPREEPLRRQRGVVSFALRASVRQRSCPSVDIGPGAPSPLAFPFRLPPTSVTRQSLAAFADILGAGPAEDTCVSRSARVHGLLEANVLSGAGATGVQATRQAELDRLACCLADGSDVCLVCVCFPRRCHAQEVAFELARRATELVRQRSCKRSL